MRPISVNTATVLLRDILICLAYYDWQMTRWLPEYEW